MAIAVMNRVWKHSRAKNGARLVLLAIADCCHNDDGTGAWPSMAALVAKTHLSLRAVQVALRELEKLGELKVERNSGNAGQNVYAVLIWGDAESAPPQDVHPADSAPPADSSRTPADSASGRAESAPGTIKEPSGNHQERSTRVGAASQQTIDIQARLAAKQVGTRLINEHIEARSTPPAKKIRGLLGTEVDRLIDEGASEEQIRAALALLRTNPKWGPGMLPHLVDQVAQERSDASRQAQSSKTSPNGGSRAHRPFKNPEDQSGYYQEFQAR